LISVIRSHISPFIPAPQRKQSDRKLVSEALEEDRPLTAVEIDTIICPHLAKILICIPPLLIPCVILIIVTTGTILRTQVLSVTLARASAQILTPNLVFG
jgi:hypothetical protein